MTYNEHRITPVISNYRILHEALLSRMCTLRYMDALNRT